MTPEDRELIRQLYRVAQSLVTEWESDAGEYSYRVHKNFTAPLEQAITAWEAAQPEATTNDA